MKTKNMVDRTHVVAAGAKKAPPAPAAGGDNVGAVYHVLCLHVSCDSLKSRRDLAALVDLAEHGAHTATRGCGGPGLVREARRRRRGCRRGRRGGGGLRTPACPGLVLPGVLALEIPCRARRVVFLHVRLKLSEKRLAGLHPLHVWGTPVRVLKLPEDLVGVELPGVPVLLNVGGGQRKAAVFARVGHPSEPLQGLRHGLAVVRRRAVLEGEVLRLGHLLP